MNKNYKPQRYRTVDSLRGIAALSVVFFHFSVNLQDQLASWLPELALTILSYGFLGVPVFFIISGFVIACSVGDSNVTESYAEKFIL